MSAFIPTKRPQVGDRVKLLHNVIILLGQFNSQHEFTITNVVKKEGQYFYDLEDSIGQTTLKVDSRMVTALD